MDEDPLQRRIYFLTFIDSLNMIFSQYHEYFRAPQYFPFSVPFSVRLFERENIDRENIKDIKTRLRMTQIDEQKMEQKMENIEERENIHVIET